MAVPLFGPGILYMYVGTIGELSHVTHFKGSALLVSQLPILLAFV